MKTKKFKYILFFLLTSILGLVAVVLPPAALSLKSCNQDLIFPLFSVGIEGLSIFGITLMIFVGFIPGFVFGEKHFVWGLASIALFPVLLLLEINHNSSSHSLWPLEIFLYFFLFAVATSGSIIGLFAKDMKKLRDEYKKTIKQRKTKRV